MTRVPGDADIVFFPTQKPGDAQTFARQLVEQGKKAKVFGGDGSNDPGHFNTPGAYVSNFAPDITGLPADKALIAGCLAREQQGPDPEARKRMIDLACAGLRARR